MGVVYVAEHLETGRPVALKLLQDEHDARARERFAQEARLAAQIDSDHAVAILDAGHDEGRAFLVMELLHGETLASLQQRLGPLSLADAALMLAHVGHAMKEAHRRSIVHRDLKPENLFVCAPRRAGAAYTVKVLDFGLARAFEPGMLLSTPAGTLPWMAPEQLKGQAVGPQTDLWAFGLIAFSMLTGRPFWRFAQQPSASPMEVVGLYAQEVLGRPVPAASERARELGASGLPAAFDGWFATCVQRDPAARFPEVGTALAELERILPAALEQREAHLALEPSDAVAQGSSEHGLSATFRRT